MWLLEACGQITCKVTGYWGEEEEEGVVRRKHERWERERWVD
jgi:hypothetical protein